MTMKSPTKTFILLLLALSAGGLFILVGGRLPATRAEVPVVQPQPVAIPLKISQPSDIDIQALWTLTNEERAKVGAQAVALNPSLNQSAQAKCNDMVARNYWSHNTPDGVLPWVFLDRFSVKYRQAGENLAFGYASAYSTSTGWMNSPTHKANILDPRFDNVGFGVCVSDNFVDKGRELITVQFFIND